MPLPILEAPRYEVTVPSTGKKYSYRPYLVKEEKILMIALESNDEKQILNAMKDVIESCTFNKIKADNLCTFDLEYIFLKLRAKSVGEVSKVGLKCEKCEKSTPVEINIDEIEIDMNKKPKSTIKLTEKISVTLSWPKMKDAVNFVKTEENQNDRVNTAIDIIASCIEAIHDNTKTYKAEDSTKEELIQFIESLNQKQFAKIQEYIEAMPKMEHTANFKCSDKNCGHDNSIVLSGLQNFF